LHEIDAFPPEERPLESPKPGQSRNSRFAFPPEERPLE